MATSETIIALENMLIEARAAVKNTATTHKEDGPSVMNYNYWGTLRVNAIVLRNELNKLIAQMGEERVADADLEAKAATCLIHYPYQGTIVEQDPWKHDRKKNVVTCRVMFQVGNSTEWGEFKVKFRPGTTEVVYATL